MNHFGLGDNHAQFCVYVEKSPPVATLWGEAPLVETLRPLAPGDIYALGQRGGNGWRKVFNVYAKWLFALNGQVKTPVGDAPSWQDFRDTALLQSDSQTALLFGDWDVPYRATSGGIHVVAGRTYANQLGLSEQCVWLDNEFARHPELPIIICPYFDYRQLSNAKIDILNRLLLAITTAKN